MAGGGLRRRVVAARSQARAVVLERHCTGSREGCSKGSTHSFPLLLILMARRCMKRACVGVRGDGWHACGRPQQVASVGSAQCNSFIQLNCGGRCGAGRSGRAWEETCWLLRQV